MFSGTQPTQPAGAKGTQPVWDPISRVGWHVHTGSRGSPAEAVIEGKGQNRWEREDTGGGRQTNGGLPEKLDLKRGYTEGSSAITFRAALCPIPLSPINGVCSRLRAGNQLAR